jgi:tRNA (guanine37-N1)-methyltransferase
MTFHIVTIFPHIFDSYFNEGIIRRATKVKKNFVIEIYDLRNYTEDKHRTVDDTPFGGGPGMVLKVEPIFRCLQEIKAKIGDETSKVILFSAKGDLFNQEKAQQWSTNVQHLILICGRYEGVDERVAMYLADEEISIGNYVLTGGEIPAMAVVDAVSRLIPGVLGNPDSLVSETHCIEQAASDYPVFTRPEIFNGWEVPEVLRSGDHKKIGQWRDKQRKKLKH